MARSALLIVVVFVCAGHRLGAKISEMSAWGRSEFGDPCRGCGFSWSLPLAAACDVVAAAGSDYTDLLRGQDGRKRLRGLEWTATGYVCHVGDSIRVWSERVATVAFGASGEVAPYNQNVLAQARHYEQVDLSAALWSLQRAVGDWLAALDLVGDRAFAMDHEELGTMTLSDVVLIRAHDVSHHRWDIERTLAEGSAG